MDHWTAPLHKHMPVLSNGEVVGEITSGCFSPTFNKPIAMAIINSEVDCPQVDMDFGRVQLEAQVVKLPFYKRDN